LAFVFSQLTGGDKPSALAALGSDWMVMLSLSVAVYNRHQKNLFQWCRCPSPASHRKLLQCSSDISISVLFWRFVAFGLGFMQKKRRKGKEKRWKGMQRHTAS